MPFLQPIRRNLLIDEIIHGVVALPFALYLYYKTKKVNVFFYVMVATYAIDADHLFDYFYTRGLYFSLRDFFSLNYFNISNRAFVLFHGWEYLILLFLFAKNKKWDSIFHIILFAMIPHLMYDSLGVGSFWFYSIIHRISNSFQAI